MTTAYELARTIFAELTRSDTIGPQPSRWFTLTTGGMAHILMGAMAAWFEVCLWFVAAFVLGWIAKELIYDTNRPDFQAIVVFDSIVDMTLALWAWQYVRAELLKLAKA